MELRRGEQGFTLIEVLVVLIIMGILVAVVSINVVGLLGRGEEEAFDTDERTIQLAVTSFYADIHAYKASDGWNENGGLAGHKYPTVGGNDSALYCGAEVQQAGHKVFEVWSAPNVKATTDQIDGAAIWTGLLVNNPGSGTGIAPVPDTRDNSAPLEGEEGPYLNPLPESCSVLNSANGKGTITWIVGSYGRVYGVWEKGGVWYSGFGGRYP